MRMNKSYSELISFETFEERFNYLKLNGNVGAETFGYDRYLNQVFYHSDEWKDFRRKIIIRDNGCDLGVEGYDIHRGIMIHHINPINADDIVNRDYSILLNPENVISVSLQTHNAIHYGDDSIVKSKSVIERKPNDTCPWKH